MAVVKMLVHLGGKLEWDLEIELALLLKVLTTAKTWVIHRCDYQTEAHHQRVHYGP
jgi:hypothetical protein